MITEPLGGGGGFQKAPRIGNIVHFDAAFGKSAGENWKEEIASHLSCGARPSRIGAYKNHSRCWHESPTFNVADRLWAIPFGASTGCLIDQKYRSPTSLSSWVFDVRTSRQTFFSSSQQRRMTTRQRADSFAKLIHGNGTYFLYDLNRPRSQCEGKAPNYQRNEPCKDSG